MSEKLINHSPDLKKLREKGADLEVRDGYLILHSIPYVTSERGVALGALVSELPPDHEQSTEQINHQVWFTGAFPCDRNGKPMEPLRHTDGKHTLCDGLVANHRFSCKPPGGYPNYYEKMANYVEIISNPARSLDESVTPYPFKPIRDTEEDSVFYYTDTASSRYGISGLVKKCAMEKVAIVGLGGTGSYILDLIAKNHIKEIHLFDGDKFIQHNAFRAPGAAPVEDLEKAPSKVTYYAELYGKMRRGLYAHAAYIDDDNIGLLKGNDFVFLCVDKPAVRKLVFDYLIEKAIPFIDTGMGLEYIEESQCLIGDCRATLCTPQKMEHLSRRVSTDDASVNDIYDSNIQVAEMNAMNAVFAVIKWKKYCGFYQDLYKEHHTTYSINTHQLTRDEVTA